MWTEITAEKQAASEAEITAATCSCREEKRPGAEEASMYAWIKEVTFKVQQLFGDKLLFIFLLNGNRVVWFLLVFTYQNSQVGAQAAYFVNFYHF